MAAQPLQLMASSLSNVLFPTLSTLRNTPRQQGQAGFRAAKILGLAIMPSAALQAALIGPAIHLFFPDHKWDDSIQLIQVLSIGLGFNAIALGRCSPRAAASVSSWCTRRFACRCS